MSSGYTVLSGASAALTAATARTCLGVKAHANSGILIKSIDAMLDGVTASWPPTLLELCYCTWATNSPGTNSTSISTIPQIYGRTIAAQATAAYNWTAGNEPTVLTPIRAWWIPSDKGVIAYQFPLGQEPDCALAEGFALRFTSGTGATPNARAGLVFERN